jgi:hypothetical protein
MQKDADEIAASLIYLLDVGLLHSKSSSMYGLSLQVQSSIFAVSDFLERLDGVAGSYDNSFRGNSCFQ